MYIDRRDILQHITYTQVILCVFVIYVNIYFVIILIGKQIRTRACGVFRPHVTIYNIILCR